MDLYTLNEYGEPTSCEDIVAWDRWFATADRRVVYTQYRGVRISTVFLGMDHGFPALEEQSTWNYRPVLWETMVFGGPLDQEMERYRSREDAEKGHARWVREAVAAIEAVDALMPNVVEERTTS